VPEITITSYESPIEKIIPGILQIEHDYTDNWFDSVSKILSKVDSDIVAVSEYRTFKEFNEINNNSDRKQILSTTHCKDIRSFFNIIKSYSIEGQEELNEKTIAQ
jgi:type II secretory ATPase GspE/PulE/Tfp pilus assembly ATPase PilB-like protein